MHRYSLNVDHHLYMLHDDMCSVDDHLLFDIYLQIDILDLDMFVDDGDFFVLKIIQWKKTEIYLYDYEQLIHPRSVNDKDESIHLSHWRPAANEWHEHWPVSWGQSFRVEPYGWQPHAIRSYNYNSFFYIFFKDLRVHPVLLCVNIRENPQYSFSQCEQLGPPTAGRQ
jgi:hypothetical protein